LPGSATESVLAAGVDGLFADWDGLADSLLSSSLAG
jgi:hypothetical protein